MKSNKGRRDKILMCVEVRKGAKLHKTLIGYKVFELWHGRPHGWAYNTSICYEPGKRYSSARGSGFQAFKSLRCAKAFVGEFFNMPSSDHSVQKVLLEEAREGVIRGMDTYADGKRGIVGKYMTILPKEKH